MTPRRALPGLVILMLVSPVHGQVPADQQAEMILNSARKATNEANFPFAIQRFNEFLQKFGGHPQASSARLQLAIVHLDSPERQFDKAIEALGPIIGNAGLPEHPSALYYHAYSVRGLGLRELEQLAAKPNESAQIMQRADQRFGEAAQRFSQAAAAYSAKLPKEIGENPPSELHWAARSRCDQAEMELRLRKAKEAKATAEPFANDPNLARSRYAKLGLYYHGFAAFLTQDFLVAGRSLAQLTPYDDPHFGLHARYLMGRVYQATEARAEAGQAFDAVVLGYEQQKKDAIESLKRPEQFAKNLPERQRLERLVRDPPPDHVVASLFFNACLVYETGKFGEALGKFQDLIKTQPNASQVPEAQLRIGFCQVQMKMYPEAAATLTPLIEKQPKLADQAQFWLGKAQVGLALAIVDPAKTGERENALRTALTTIRGAADRANNLIQADPEAKSRRAEMLIEMADTQQMAKQYREAAATYEQVINEKTAPNRIEELQQRLIVALHLAGEFQRSDQVATQFLQQFPESPLRLPVMLRLAENAYFVGLANEKKSDPNSRNPEVMRQFDEAAKRYSAVIEKGAEFDRVSLARFGLAMCHFKKGEFDKAKAALDPIPNADRAGEMAYVPYLLADCLLRGAPATASGAAETRKLLESLEQAAGHLDGFISSNPKAPEVPEAMLKLGTCQMRQAALIAVPQERAPIINAARATFEKLLQQFPQAPIVPQARMERAKCINIAGDRGGAINELRQFTQDPLRNSPVASFAVLQLATLLREQNQAEEAAKVLASAREKHEPTLQKDPEQIALLRYHHGVALQEAGKFAEARQALESIAPLVQNKPLAIEGSLRAGQCRIAEGRKLLETARPLLANTGLKPDQLNAAQQQWQQGVAALTESAQNLERQAEAFKPMMPISDARERMYYEAAWAWRTLADHDFAVARAKVQADKQKAMQAEADKQSPTGKAPVVALPEVPRAQVPLQPTEKRAREVYAVHIANFSDSLLSIDSRFELSELLSEREEHDAAIKLLKDANDVEPRGDKLPTAELVDRIRIRLGACLVAKKDLDAALGYFDAVGNNPKSPLMAQGIYRAGEVLLLKGETAKAIEKLAMFRDKGELHNIPQVSDRALLRLGYALGLEKKWVPSQQAYELLVNRFGGSSWVHEARYGIGWAMQNAGQYDPAVNWYQQVINGTTSEVAAKAHLQIGLCRMEQKRYGDAVASLLIVPFTFDYPDLSAAALTEAARALTADNKPEQAQKLLQKVVKDFPNTEWAKAAQEKLSK